MISHSKPLLIEEKREGEYNMLKALEAIYENGNIRFLSQSEKGIYKAIVDYKSKVASPFRVSKELHRY
jgi:hypothetical protein